MKGDISRPITVTIEGRIRKSLLKAFIEVFIGIDDRADSLAAFVFTHRRIWLQVMFMVINDRRGDIASKNAILDA